MAASGKLGRRMVAARHGRRCKVVWRSRDRTDDDGGGAPAGPGSGLGGSRWDICSRCDGLERLSVSATAAVARSVSLSDRVWEVVSLVQNRGEERGPWLWIGLGGGLPWCERVRV